MIQQTTFNSFAHLHVNNLLFGDFHYNSRIRHHGRVVNCKGLQSSKVVGSNPTGASNILLLPFRPKHGSFLLPLSFLNPVYIFLISRFSPKRRRHFSTNSHPLRMQKRSKFLPYLFYNTWVFRNSVFRKKRLFYLKLGLQKNDNICGCI